MQGRYLGLAVVAVVFMLVSCLCCWGAPATQVVQSSYHSVALESDGSVWTWGQNEYGQRGNGSIIEDPFPTQVPGLGGVTAVACSDYHNLALKSDGSVWTWGRNDYGQLGDGTQIIGLTPVRVVSLTDVVQVAAGLAYSVVVRSDGTVWTWGYNYKGQLGDGTTATQRLSPVQVVGLTGVVKVVVGDHFNIALKNDGSVWAWGYNYYGQLGNGTTTYSSTPVQVAGLNAVTNIWANANNAFAVKSDGTVWAWGNNSGGQFGDGTETSRTTPVQVSALSGTVAISTRGSIKLALKSDGNVWVWGYDFYTNTRKLTPVHYLDLTGVIGIATGYDHAIVLKGDGSVWVWGKNDYGQLTAVYHVYATRPYKLSIISGVNKVMAYANSSTVIKSDGSVWIWGSYRFGNGTLPLKSFPGQSPYLTGVTKVTAGCDYSAAVKSDGTIRTWGKNDYGQVGDGTKTDSRPIPAQATGMSGVSTITAGKSHTAALKNDGTVWMWGANQYGQLGQGYAGHDDQGGWSTLPVQIPEFSGVTALSANENFTSAVKGDGTVWTWGSNEKGQLGYSTYPYTSRATPTQVSGLADVASASAGGLHTVVLKQDGTVWAWGYNEYGQLGDGTNTDRATPVQVSGLTGVVAIAAGAYHTIALKSDGTVWAWGLNNYGQLGDGTTSWRKTPVQISGLSGVTAIDTKNNHTVALKNDGTVWIWGENYYYGQIGDGSFVNRLTPVQVIRIFNATAIAAGYRHTIVLRNDGTVWGWGKNDCGETGDGYSRISFDPIQVILDAAAPTSGSVTINNGDAYTSNQTVIVTLSSTDEGEPISDMRISNDGVFDTEPWENYSTSKSWTLVDGEGARTVYAKFRNVTGVESETTSATIVRDTSAPVIGSVQVTPAIAEAGSTLQVTVQVTDVSGVESVTANGVALNKTGATTWTGEMTAATEPGNYNVAAVAADIFGYSSSSNGSYTIVNTVAICGRGLSDTLTSQVASTWPIRVCGKVTALNTGSFDLETSSGIMVRVVAPGYSSIAVGNMVSARGTLDNTTTPFTLTGDPAQVVKYD